MPPSGSAQGVKVERMLSVALALSLLVGAPAHALHYAMYKKFNVPNTEGWTEQRIHIQGTLSGLTAANEALDLDSKPKLYCIPDRLVLNDDNLQRIIETHIKSDLATGAKEADILIEVELLLGLEDTFPCKS